MELNHQDAIDRLCGRDMAIAEQEYNNSGYYTDVQLIMVIMAGGNEQCTWTLGHNNTPMH